MLKDSFRIHNKGRQWRNIVKREEHRKRAHRIRKREWMKKLELMKTRSDSIDIYRALNFLIKSFRSKATTCKGG